MSTEVGSITPSMSVSLANISISIGVSYLVETMSSLAVGGIKASIPMVTSAVSHKSSLSHTSYSNVSKPV